MRKSMIGSLFYARSGVSLLFSIAMVACGIGSSSAAAQNACNYGSIEHIRSAWFALNTYVADNKERSSENQSFSYADLGHLAYDVGQMVHVFDGAACYKAIEFLIELKSYAITDAAIGEEISAMIRKRPSEARKAAKTFLAQTVSPCLRWYEGSKEELLNKPSAYCIEPTYWKAFLQEFVMDTHEKKRVPKNNK